MLSPQAWERFRGRLHELGEFGRVLQEDFIQAENAVYAARLNLTESRAMVRAFGSLIDGLSLVMQELSISTAEVFGRGYNRFLREKREERATTTYQRIYNSYRLVAEFVPKCPLANLPDARWDELHEAIEIRNRILHPGSAKDLELSQVDISVALGAGENFLRDFAQFLQWFQHKEQKLLWEHTLVRKRFVPKVQRNEDCPCGSGLKYKKCCEAAQRAA